MLSELVYRRYKPIHLSVAHFIAIFAGGSRGVCAGHGYKEAEQLGERQSGVSEEGCRLVGEKRRMDVQESEQRVYELDEKRRMVWTDGSADFVYDYCGERKVAPKIPFSEVAERIGGNEYDDERDISHDDACQP